MFSSNFGGKFFQLSPKCQPDLPTSLDSTPTTAFIITNWSNGTEFIFYNNQLANMIYNVAQLLKEPVGSTRHFSTDFLEDIDNGAIEILPQGQVYLLRTDRGILVRAQLKARLQMICSRCLASFQQQVSLSLEEEFLPRVDVSNGQSLHLPDDAEASFTIDQNHMLDLSEAGRQYCLTNQPMKPLCRQACLGFCQVCGQNKNDDVCTCDSGAGDPRWGALADLLVHGRR